MTKFFTFLKKEEPQSPKSEKQEKTEKDQVKCKDLAGFFYFSDESPSTINMEAVCKKLSEKAAKKR